MRLDKFLADNKYTASRSKAAQLIKEGAVRINGKTVLSASADVKGDENIEVDSSLVRYVSRGGLKLLGALTEFSLDVSGMKAVDIGASTGGFTDCLLDRGARQVYAVDSGSMQLAEKLKSDKRVVSIENFNARDLTDEITDGKCDVAVCDLSFISQTLVYPALTRVLADNGYFVSLIKPQFEVGRSNVGKGGIVRDEKARKRAVEFVVLTARRYGLELVGSIESPIKGGDGNTEYLALFIYREENNTCKGDIG